MTGAICAMPLRSVTTKLRDRDGEEARVGGGAGCNTLLRLPVAEIDVATTALLEEVMPSTAPSLPSSIITRSRSRRRGKVPKPMLLMGQPPLKRDVRVTSVYRSISDGGDGVHEPRAVLRASQTAPFEGLRLTA